MDHPQRHCSSAGHPRVAGAGHGAPGRRQFWAEIRPRARTFSALLARASKRPVPRLVNSREEEMLTCLFRENADIRIRSAVTKEGEIVGREAIVLMDCGAYGGELVFLSTMTAHTLSRKIVSARLRLFPRAIYTNTTPNGAFRCCNGVYNTFALERHTDEIAERIGMDPFAFRRCNVLGGSATAAQPAKCSKETCLARCSIA